MKAKSLVTCATSRVLTAVWMDFFARRSDAGIDLYLGRTEAYARWRILGWMLPFWGAVQLVGTCCGWCEADLFFVATLASAFLKDYSLFYNNDISMEPDLYLNKINEFYHEIT